MQSNFVGNILNDQFQKIKSEEENQIYNILTRYPDEDNDKNFAQTKLIEYLINPKENGSLIQRGMVLQVKNFNFNQDSIKTKRDFSCLAQNFQSQIYSRILQQALNVQVNAPKQFIFPNIFNLIPLQMIYNNNQLERKIDIHIGGSSTLTYIIEYQFEQNGKSDTGGIQNQLLDQTQEQSINYFGAPVRKFKTDENMIKNSLSTYLDYFKRKDEGEDTVLMQKFLEKVYCFSDQASQEILQEFLIRSELLAINTDLLLHIGGLYLPLGIGVLHQNESLVVEEILQNLLKQLSHVFGNQKVGENKSLEQILFIPQFIQQIEEILGITDENKQGFGGVKFSLMILEIQLYHFLEKEAQIRFSDDLKNMITLSNGRDYERVDIEKMLIIQSENIQECSNDRKAISDLIINNCTGFYTIREEPEKIFQTQKEVDIQLNYCQKIFFKYFKDEYKLLPIGIRTLRLFQLTDKLNEQTDEFDKFSTEWRYIQKVNLNSNFIKNYPQFIEELRYYDDCYKTSIYKDFLNMQPSIQIVLNSKYQDHFQFYKISDKFIENSMGDLFGDEENEKDLQNQSNIQLTPQDRQRFKNTISFLNPIKKEVVYSAPITTDYQQKSVLIISINMLEQQQNSYFSYFVYKLMTCLSQLDESLSSEKNANNLFDNRLILILYIQKEFTQEMFQLVNKYKFIEFKLAIIPLDSQDQRIFSIYTKMMEFQIGYPAHVQLISQEGIIFVSTSIQYFEDFSKIVVEDPYQRHFLTELFRIHQIFQQNEYNNENLISKGIIIEKVQSELNQLKKLDVISDKNIFDQIIKKNLQPIQTFGQNNIVESEISFLGNQLCLLSTSDILFEGLKYMGQLSYALEYITQIETKSSSDILKPQSEKNQYSRIVVKILSKQKHEKLIRARMEQFIKNNLKSKIIIEFNYHPSFDLQFDQEDEESAQCRTCLKTFKELNSIQRYFVVPQDQKGQRQCISCFESSEQDFINFTNDHLIQNVVFFRNQSSDDQLIDIDNDRMTFNDEPYIKQGTCANCDLNLIQLERSTAVYYCAICRPGPISKRVTQTPVLFCKECGDKFIYKNEKFNPQVQSLFNHDDDHLLLRKQI